MVTNYIKNATYKEIYDIHTDTESTSILTLHSPINNFPRKMLKGFFDQYRKFKYKGATVTMRPAATLPADPEQISYEAGEIGIDPRDMLNPVLFRGYSGESLGTFLNLFNVAGAQSKYQQKTAGGAYDTFINDGWFGSSVDKASFFDQSDALDWRSTYLERLYYQSLGDGGFYKIRPQRGFRKNLYPLVYELATTTQRLAHNSAAEGVTDTATTPGQLVYGRLRDGNATGTSNMTSRKNLEKSADAKQDPSNHPVGTFAMDNFYDVSSLPYQWMESKQYENNSNVNRWYIVRKTQPVLTSHKRRLGWLDTDSVVVNTVGIEGVSQTGSPAYSSLGVPPSAVINPADLKTQVVNTTLPLINMGMLIFPKAYKQEMFWRLEVTHHFDFCKFRNMYGLVSPFDYDNLGAGPILEWSDWDSYGEQVYPVSSVTSTSKNVDLVQVQGMDPESIDEPATAETS